MAGIPTRVRRYIKDYLEKVAESDSVNAVFNTVRATSGATVEGELDLGDAGTVSTTLVEDGDGVFRGEVDTANGDDWMDIVGISDVGGNGDDAVWGYHGVNGYMWYVYNYSTFDYLLQVYENGDVDAPSGKLYSGSTPVLTTDDQQVINSGVVTLSSNSATVSTGVTSTGASFDVALDPSGNGNNSADVKVTYRVFWDNAAGEYKVDILEDGTNVGNPDVGYEIVQH